MGKAPSGTETSTRGIPSTAMALPAPDRPSFLDPSVKTTMPEEMLEARACTTRRGAMITDKGMTRLET